MTVLAEQIALELVDRVAESTKISTTTSSKIITSTLKGFIYKNELHIRCIPVRALFNSKLIHGATVRGDIFAMRVSDQGLTIVPGTAQVQHVEINKDLLEQSARPRVVVTNDPR